MASASKVTTEGQVTIPKEVRERLRIQAGDVLFRGFQEKPFDAGWHRALSPTLADEWNAPEDDEAFGNL